MFGNYDILETIGQGGMGVVYRAHDVNLDRVVALKVLREDLRTSASVVARFRREGEAFASLNHPNIVHIYSVGSVGKIPYIAMECIDGEPLSRMMKREKQVHWKKAFEIGEQIAEALASAHEALIIHRDIKPGNILIDEEGGAFVTDFGIAKVLTAETQLTIDGSRLGTPQYMSPERCRNEEVTAASDTYSLGVVLFQLISGRLPYEAETPVRLVRQITHDPPGRLSTYISDLPDDVERVVAFLMERNPRDRPQDAADVARLLNRVLNGKPLIDEESGVGSAMGDLRESLRTPNPSTSQWDSTSMDGAQPLLVALRRRWRHAPDSFKAVLYGGVFVAAAAMMGLVVASRLNEGYAIDVVDQMDLGVVRWQDSAIVGEFTDETAGVTLVRLTLPDFEFGRALWTTGNGALVTLSGAPQTARAGQSMLISLRPYRRVAEVLWAPALVEAGDTPATSLQWESPDGPVSAVVVVAKGDHSGPRLRAWDPSLPLGDARALVRDRELAAAAGWEASAAIEVHHVATYGGTDARLAVALSRMGNMESTVLVSVPVGSTAEANGRALSLPGLPIEAVQFAPSGEWITYLRETAQGQSELWVVAAEAAESDGRVLMTGSISLAPGAIDPEGERIALRVDGAAGESTIKLVNRRTGSVTDDLGRGTAAVWHTSGSTLIVTTQDAKGEYQLWRVNANAPHGREQLTFLDGGTTPTCSLSLDGRFVVAGGRDGNLPWAVIVELAENPTLR